MQNKELNKYLLLPVPLEDCIKAGIHENCVLQTYTENGRIVLSAVTSEDYVCDGDCDTCPCNENCDESEEN